MSLRTNLVAYWNFEEGSGTTTADRSGNGNTATLVNTPTWTTGIQGGGIDLEAGSSQYMTAVAPNLGNAFSISAWFKPESATVSAIVSQAYTGGRVPYLLGFGTEDGTAALKFGFWDTSAWRLVVSGVTINNATWYHACGTWDGTTLKLLVNGTLATATPGGTSAATADTLYIGRRHDATYGSQYFDGIIDEVALYNRALTPFEASRLYSGGVGRSFNNFIASPVGV